MTPKKIHKIDAPPSKIWYITCDQVKGAELIKIIKSWLIRYTMSGGKPLGGKKFPPDLVEII